MYINKNGVILPAQISDNVDFKEKRLIQRKKDIV